MNRFRQTIWLSERETISSISKNGSRCGIAAWISARDMCHRPLHQQRIHVIRHDHSVVHRPEPAAHDDPDAAGMIQAGNLLRNAAAHRQALELRAETRPLHVLRVMLERDGRRGLGVIELVADVGNVFGQAVERRLDQVLLARFVFLRAELRPVVVVGVRARDDETAIAPRPRAVGNKTKTCGS